MPFVAVAGGGVYTSIYAQLSETVSKLPVTVIEEEVTVESSTVKVNEIVSDATLTMLILNGMAMNPFSSDTVN